MKVSESTTNLINQAYSNGKNPEAAKTDVKPDKNRAAKAGDSVALSSTTQDLQKVSKAMDTDAAARAEKVSAIKKRVDQGTYTVDAGKVAAKMADTFINDMI